MTGQARIYKRGHVRKRNDRLETFEDVILHAVWVHRWLPDSFQRIERQLRGEVMSWPEILLEYQDHGRHEAMKPGRPRLDPKRDIGLHDYVFGLSDGPNLFRGLHKFDFEKIWLRGAFRKSFQEIGDKVGRDKQWARRAYRDAIRRVKENAYRGSFEI